MIKKPIASLVLAGLLASPLAVAGISGSVQGCSASEVQKCDEVAVLRLQPDATITSTESALFVVIYPSVNGEVQPGVGAYFTRNGWELSGNPKVLTIGSVRQQTARIPIPSGVCGLVAKYKVPAGDYVLMAGWGRTNMGMDEGEGLNIRGLLEEARTADAATRAQINALIQEYRNARQRMQVPNGKEAMAFTDMKSRNSYWPIKNYSCR